MSTNVRGRRWNAQRLDPRPASETRKKLHYVVYNRPGCYRCVTMPRPKLPRTPDGKPATLQRTYRFDTVLFERFEEDCLTNLANPNLVLQALVAHWLAAKPEARRQIAGKLPRRAADGDPA